MTRPTFGMWVLKQEANLSSRAHPFLSGDTSLLKYKLAVFSDHVAPNERPVVLLNWSNQKHLRAQYFIYFEYRFVIFFFFFTEMLININIYINHKLKRLKCN